MVIGPGRYVPYKTMDEELNKDPYKVIEYTTSEGSGSYCATDPSNYYTTNKGEWVVWNSPTRSLTKIKDLTIEDLKRDEASAVYVNDLKKQKIQSSIYDTLCKKYLKKRKKK